MTIATDKLMLAERPQAAAKPQPAFSMAELGPTLEAFIVIAEAHQTARMRSMASQRLPEPDKIQRRRMRRLDEAHAARTKAIAEKDRKALSAANSTIRALSMEVRRLRNSQLEALDTSRAALDRAVMARVRGEPLEEVETVVVDWARDEHGVKKLRRGRAILVEEIATTLRIGGRTGLQQAFANGHLDGGTVRAEILYEIGKRYATAFVALSRTRLGVGGEYTGGGGGSSDAAERTLDEAQTLRTYRHTLTIRQRKVLDLICGEDETVLGASKALGLGRTTVKRHLVAGLISAWENATLG